MNAGQTAGNFGGCGNPGQVIFVSQAKLDALIERLDKHLVWVMQPSQDGRVNAGTAQFERLGNIRNTKVINASFFELAGHFNHSVTIGVGLDHTANLHPTGALAHHI